MDYVDSVCGSVYDTEQSSDDVFNMKRKYNSYSVTITDDYLTSDYSDDKSILDWASEHISNV